MGQYFRIANLDKRETLDPFKFGSGLKLTESCYVGNHYVDAITHLLANDWHGDRVLLCGDYAWSEEGGSAAGRLRALAAVVASLDGEVLYSGLNRDELVSMIGVQSGEDFVVREVGDSYDVAAHTQDSSGLDLDLEARDMRDTASSFSAESPDLGRDTIDR